MKYKNVHNRYKDYLCHHGILGMKWGIRRYQNKDGTYTELGKQRLKTKSPAEAQRDVSEYLKTQDDNLKKMQDASDQFNKLGEELAEDYPRFYKSLNNPKDLEAIKKEVFEKAEYDFGDGTDDPEYFDLMKLEYTRPVILSRTPKDLKEKVAAFYKAGDEYFETVDKIVKPFVEMYTSQGIEGISSKPITKAFGETEVKTFVQNATTDTIRWNAYMYRHFDDYWVNDVPELYKLEEAITAEDYNKWAANRH